MRNALVSAVVAAVVSVVMFFVLRAAVGPGPAGGTGGPQVDVPNLAGLKPDQARQLLEPRGLQLELTEQVDDPRYEPGSISDQQPLSSSRVARGTSIETSDLQLIGAPRATSDILKISSIIMFRSS